MSEAAERVKAGEARAGQACRWCTGALGAEDDAAICAECGATYHEACWDRELGCAGAECANAPLKQLAEPAAGAEEDAPAAGRVKKKKKLRSDAKLCVDCGEQMPIYEEICPDCHAINTPDGIYHGPKTNAPGAVDSLVLGIAGLLFCGPLLGIWAIRKSQEAKESMRRNPRYGGEGLATAGFVMGVIDISVWVIGLLARVAQS
jgi:hypothetical protein